MKGDKTKQDRERQPDVAREIEERGRDGRMKDGWRTLAASGAGEVER